MIAVLPTENESYIVLDVCGPLIPSNAEIGAVTFFVAITIHMPYVIFEDSPKKRIPDLAKEWVILASECQRTSHVRK